MFRSNAAGETWITDNRGLGGSSPFFLGAAAKSLFGSFVVFASDGDLVYRKNGPHEEESEVFLLMGDIRAGSVFLEKLPTISIELP